MRQILCGSLVLGLYLGTASHAQSAYIYFSEFNGGTIGRANLDGTGKITLVSGMPNPVGPTLDLARGHMYWGEAGGANIWRANLDGTGRTILVSGRNGPGPPALDLANGRMYWNDSGGGDIRRANLDGSGQQVLVTGQNDPHAVVLDLVAGKIYWPEFGGGTIRRADLDGSGSTVVVQGQASPALMTLDVAGGKMYWSGQGSGDIRRANLDGSSQEILLRNQSAPSGVAVDAEHGHVYWANSGGGEIRRANLDGSGQQVLITGLNGPAGVTLDLISDGPPVIQFQPQNQSAPLSNSAAFTVVAVGSKPLFHQWQFNGAALNGATNAMLTLSNLTLGNAGSYRVVISNSLGSVISQTAVLSVAPIVITSQTANTNVWPGSNVTFQVAINSTVPASCQWRFNGTNILGATNLTFSITNVQLVHEGEYTAVLANSFGSVTSAPARLVLLVRPVIAQQPQSLTVVIGQRASFGVTADGTRPISYRWVKNSTTYLPFELEKSSLIFNPVVWTNAGRYRVALTNAATPTGVASPEAHLVVVLPPTNQTAQPGATVTFSAQANGPVPISYQWQFNGNAIADATSTNFVLTNVQPAQAGTYTLIVSNALGLATAFPATLIVGTAALPPLTIARSGTNLVITWPVSAAVWILERTFTLPSAPENWIVVSGVFQTNEANVWITTPTSSRAFFRLRQP